MTEKEMSPQTIKCSWCGGDISFSAVVCPLCYLPVENNTAEKNTSSPVKAKSSAPRKASGVGKEKIAAKTRDEWVTEINASYKRGDTIVVGIDPGARYIGFCIRNDHNEIFVSSTFRRSDEVPDSVDWAKQVVQRVKDELEGVNYHVIGIEGIADPKGFKGGKRDALNPKDIIRTGVVVGALSISYPDAYIVRPRSNGSKDSSAYPDCLNGRRPADLGGGKDVGVTVRDHERSAYDVSEHALFAYIQSRRP